MLDCQHRARCPPPRIGIRGRLCPSPRGRGTPTSTAPGCSPLPRGEVEIAQQFRVRAHRPIMPPHKKSGPKAASSAGFRLGLPKEQCSDQSATQSRALASSAAGSNAAPGSRVNSRAPSARRRASRFSITVHPRGVRQDGVLCRHLDAQDGGCGCKLLRGVRQSLWKSRQALPYRASAKHGKLVG